MQRTRSVQCSSQQHCSVVYCRCLRYPGLRSPDDTIPSPTYHTGYGLLAFFPPVAFLPAVYETSDGGFRYWLGNYKDYLFDAKANREVYNFWAKKQRLRINDDRKRDLLCPLEPPHPWGVKRPCLEYAYFEQFNRENVDVVNIKDNPIKSFDESGINLEDGTHYDFDVICIATGFDITTGGMTNMGLKSINGTTLQDEWKKAAYTYLGTTISGYPNMFHLYGPHGPTRASSLPSII